MQMTAVSTFFVGKRKFFVARIFHKRTQATCRWADGLFWMYYFFSVFFALGSFFSTKALRWGRYTWKPMRPSGCLVAV